MDLWRIERELAAAGSEPICGVDEAGRGPLAGPVFAAAVILPFGLDLKNLNDSKKLSQKIRDKLYDEIVESAISFGIALADVKEIEELNILKATFLAMNRAIDSLKVNPGIALIDGNRDPLVKCRSRLVVGGDVKSASIAAASILAKVSRDRYMAEIAKAYPQYAFDKHKGYGTRQHCNELLEHGPSEIHRISFLKKMQSEDGIWKTKNGMDREDQESRAGTVQRGKWGESQALDYLKSKSYIPVAESVRSRYGEIDLIVKNSEYIVFVEVKLRKSANFAHAREFVGKDKQRKIIATANHWLSRHKNLLQPRFDVIEVYAPDGSAQPEIIHIENAF